MKPARLMVLASLLAAAVLCAPALASSSTTTVSANSNGRTVQIKPGARLKVVLGGASAGTGYSWNFTEKPDPSVLRVLTDGRLEKSGNCKANAVGCPQNTVFVFDAIGSTSATTKFKLVLLPPGRGAKPARTYTLTVHV